MIARVLKGRSDKLLLIVGPCSADDPDAVLEYASGLARVAARVQEKLIIIPRVFTGKPRTMSAGYMGLVHENDGIRAARRLHIDVLLSTGLTTADDLLYPSLLPYFDDVVGYFVVGARSVENQEHRLVASGINVGVGLKNPSSGNLGVLTNAISSVQSHHSFLFNGHRVRTSGNSLAHAVLRGVTSVDGKASPNYSSASLLALRDAYSAAGIANPTAIIDANHANSGKDYKMQAKIAIEVMKMRKNSPAIHEMVKGLMIESYLLEGNVATDGEAYGRSITDPCMSLADTEDLIFQIAEML